MAWRLHLSNRSVQHLEILAPTRPHAPRLLAAWGRRERVSFFELQTGAFVLEQNLTPPEVDDRNSLAWQDFVRSLNAPNGALLPLVNTDHETIHLSAHPDKRLYRAGANDLFIQLQHGTDEIKLDVVKTAQRFVQVTFDSASELTAALDNKGKLHLYRNIKRVGVYDVGLKLRDDLRGNLVIAEGGSKLFASDNRQLVMLDSMGKVLKAITTHYLIHRMVAAPNGSCVLTSDLETGVLRAYSGNDLTQTHQRFAVDLLAKAPSVQLLADLPPATIIQHPLALDNDGNLGFAMSGMVCMTSLDHMDKLPSPKPITA